MDMLCNDYKDGGKTKTLVGSIDLSGGAKEDKKCRTKKEFKESPRRLCHGRYSSLAKDVMRKAHEGKCRA